MKKLLLSIAAVVAILGTSSAQNLTVFLDGTTTDIQGQSHNFELTANVVNEHMDDFLYNNLTGSDQVWILTREIISQPADWSNYYCWGADGLVGNCYPASADVLYNSNAETIPTGGAGRLSTYITSPSSGTATYRYHVSTDGQTYIGFVDLIVNSVLEIIEAPVLTFNVAPNPANENITITTTGVNNSTVKMVDVLGNVVLEEAIIGDAKKVNVAKFRNGVYFIIVQAEGVKPVTRKVIVRH